MAAITFLSALLSTWGEQFGPFVYTSESDEITITAYVADGSTEVAIPQDILGIPVTRIGHSAFRGIRGITWVEVPATVSAIDNLAFYECADLVGLRGATNLRHIGDWGFSRCRSLQSITLPGIESLGTSAFAECSALVEVELAATMTAINALGANTFTECVSLTSFQVPEGITGLGGGMFAGCIALRTVTMPETLTFLGSAVFSRCRSLTEVTLPPGLSTLGSFAFNECTALTSIAIPSGIKEMGDTIASSIFANCVSLATVTLPPALELIGSDTFAGTTSLTSIILPSTLRIIGKRAFAGSGLTSVALPAGLRQLGNEAFMGCGSLPSLALPLSLTTLGDGVVVGCHSLTSIVVDPGHGQFSSVDGVLFNSDLSRLLHFPPGVSGSYELPSQVTRISNRAFDSARLNTLHIPAGVTNLGVRPFFESALLDFTVEDGHATLASAGGILTNLDHTEIVRYPPGRPSPHVIPDFFTRIGAYSFSGCDGSGGIFLPSTIAQIGLRAFDACRDPGIVYFAGNAPAFGEDSFGEDAAGFTFFHEQGRTGFGRMWGNAVFEMAPAVFPASAWLLAHRYSPMTSLEADPNGDGVNLLMAYALGLNPREQLRGQLPMPRRGATHLELPFSGENPQVVYSAQTSEDFRSWTTDGVTIEGIRPHVGRVLFDSPQRFLRLSVAYAHPGTTRPGHDPLRISFETATPGATSGAGTGGVQDNLAWISGGLLRGGAVHREEAFPNPPAEPGAAIVLHGTGTFGAQYLHLMSEVIDLRGIPNEQVVVTARARSFEDSAGSDFEIDDFVEAWLEGSVDGYRFSRFDAGIVIPRTTGTGCCPSTTVDHLKNLELADGEYTTFSTEDNDPVPLDLQFLRLRISAAVTSDTEYLFLDDVEVRFGAIEEPQD